MGPDKIVLGMSITKTATLKDVLYFSRREGQGEELHWYEVYSKSNRKVSVEGIWFFSEMWDENKSCRFRHSLLLNMFL